MTERSRSKHAVEMKKKEQKNFWDQTGRRFPSLCDASSTRYYRECEERLFNAYFPDLDGKKILKTDLWDEAKNTRILKYAADKKAEVYGIDISIEILKKAQAPFEEGPARSRFIVSDVRAIAFADGSFDALYSMGTIEHFLEVPQAVAECYRVLRKGAVAVIGVPNACDPFLRPLMVSVLRKLGLYAYGYERSFSFKALERLLRTAGFEIIDRNGILFMPGWLRMADLWFHTNSKRFGRLLAPAVAVFAGLHRRFPRLGRHGYLIACAVRKP
jgi:ubiquinone/menaquinone biosynthesis C-methylase UbiE